MIGTAINIAAILVAVLLATQGAQGPSAMAVHRLRWLTAGLAFYAGTTGILGVLGDSASSAFRILAIAIGSLILGNATGHLLGLQRRLQDLGLRLAPRLPSAGESPQDGRNWNALGILLALNPLLIPAAVQDGLDGRWLGLAVKSILDALALVAYGRRLTGVGSLRVLGVIVGWQACWTLAALAASPWLRAQGIRDAVLAEAGLLLICAVPAVAGIRKAHLANLVPGMFWAAVLAGIWRTGF